MVRGCRKQIYHIKHLGNAGGGYFEEAYLVLKSGVTHPAPVPADLAAEADRIIREACGRCRTGRREPYLAGRGLAFALGAASSSALIGAVALLITVV